MRPLQSIILLALLLCSIVDAAYFVRGERAKMNPFLDSMGKRGMNPFLDSMGKRSDRTFEELPTEKRYFDSLAGQSLGKRSVRLAFVPYE
ncbi:nlp-3 [Pristionchus pacificus]|uniref:Nlp-3 n=1 Tax=Pristionchus pacificus TaxID=54126 RepID=A0A2A6BCF4_PRIPA|nr:nlp-3 [Pristionchus pacificus]|eukprot:PDM63558.1 nlp-3 [Pristionchus pacificus]